VASADARDADAAIVAVAGDGCAKDADDEADDDDVEEENEGGWVEVVAAVGVAEGLGDVAVCASLLVRCEFTSPYPPLHVQPCSLRGHLTRMWFRILKARGFAVFKGSPRVSDATAAERSCPANTFALHTGHSRDADGPSNHSDTHAPQNLKSSAKVYDMCVRRVRLAQCTLQAHTLACVHHSCTHVAHARIHARTHTHTRAHTHTHTHTHSFVLSSAL
jgi:hypothetical protein